MFKDHKTAKNSRQVGVVREFGTSIVLKSQQEIVDNLTMIIE